MLRLLAVVALASALAFPAGAEPRHGKDRGGWQHKSRGHSYHRPRGVYHYRPRGPGFGSIFGGILGGIIGSQLNKPQVEEDDEPDRLMPFTPEWYAHCATKYRSFEPGTGLFTTYEGTKRFCL